MSVASFLAKLGASAPAPTVVGGAAAPASAGGITLLSTLRPGPHPLSFVWHCKRTPSQSPAELGLRVDPDMVVRGVVPSSPSDDAQVRVGLIVVLVNDHYVKSEAELYVHIQKHTECSITFFENDPVAELIAKVASAPLGLSGRAEEPNLEEIYRNNPTRYAFLAAGSPLFNNWHARLEKARFARDALHRFELEARREQELEAKRRQEAMAAEIADLDRLLDSEDESTPQADDSDRSGQSATAAGAVQHGSSLVTPIMTAEELARLHAEKAAKAAAAPRPAAVCVIQEEEPPAAPALLPTPAPKPQPASLDFLRNAILGGMGATPPPASPSLGAPIVIPNGGLPPPQHHHHHHHLPYPMAYPAPPYGAPLMPPMHYGAPGIYVPLPQAPPPQPLPPRPEEVYIGNVPVIKRTEPKPSPPPGEPPQWFRAAVRRAAEEEAQEQALAPQPPPAPDRRGAAAAKPMGRDTCNDFKRGRCNRDHCLYEHSRDAVNPPTPPPEQRYRRERDEPFDDRNRRRQPRPDDRRRD